MAMKSVMTTLNLSPSSAFHGLIDPDVVSILRIDDPVKFFCQPERKIWRCGELFLAVSPMRGIVPRLLGLTVIDDGVPSLQAHWVRAAQFQNVLASLQGRWGKTPWSKPLTRSLNSSRPATVTGSLSAFMRPAKSGRCWSSPGAPSDRSQPKA
jgi:hypothetical protein